LPIKAPNGIAARTSVEAMAHCGDCHTPRNRLQALDNKRKFAGGEAEGWLAVQHHERCGLGRRRLEREELAQYLRAGHAKGRGTASGPMAEAVDSELREHDAERHPRDGRVRAQRAAIATPDLPAPKNEPAPADPKQGFAANADERGKQVFCRRLRELPRLDRRQSRWRLRRP
jgi:hypothetical protein